MILGTTDSSSLTKMTDDDSPISSCSLKKEGITSGRGSNGNLPVIGSNSSGSLGDRKPDSCNMENNAEDS